jgi:NAD(P)-dependent dehydrogenase (short-subunit alcohol dehydrogenase family)
MPDHIARAEAASDGDALLAGRTAWVTGAGGGMGARHAERLAAVGARVACIDRDEAAAQAVVARIRSAGGSALAVRADVSAWEQMAAAAARCADELGPVEVVVANAGISAGTIDVEQLDPALWARVISVNLTGVFHTVKAAIPQMRTRGRGSVILVSSIAGLRGFGGSSAYNATKHGVIGLGRTLAIELAELGVRVNMICPAWVHTALTDAEASTRGVSVEQVLQEAADRQLIRLPITMDQVSDAVLWLASDASSAVSGIALPIDLGLLERSSWVERAR